VRIIGWRTLAYTGFVAGTSGLVVLATVLFPGSDRVTIHQGFYEAAAQVIPVLLLALMVRISTMRDWAFTGDREMKRTYAKLLEEIADSRTLLVREGAEEDDLEQLDQIAADTEAKERESSPALPPLAEMLAGAMIGTLVLGVVGIGAALATLARGSDSGPLFATALASIVWVCIGLVVFEVINFSLAPRSF
jgi:hypothetical protein